MALGWRKDYLRYKELFLRILIIYKKRQDIKVFLELLLTLLTITFFSIFALKPTVLTIVELVKSNREKQQTIQKMDKKIQDIKTAQAEYKKYSTKLTLISSSIPETPLPEIIVRQLEGITAVNSASLIGASVNEITLLGESTKKKTDKEETKLPEGIKTISYSLSATGNYSSLFNLLSNLENLRRPMIIDSVSINASDTDEGKAIIMLVSAQAPYLKE